jgi:hypothetical protein
MKKQELKDIEIFISRGVSIANDLYKKYKGDLREIKKEIKKISTPQLKKIKKEDLEFQRIILWTVKFFKTIKK